MANVIPLKLQGGEFQRFQTGDMVDPAFYSAGAGGDIALTKLAPTSSQTIPANTSAVAVRKYTIAGGTKLIIEGGARFRIL